MPRTDVKVPGATAIKIVLESWTVSNGEAVTADQQILVLSADSYFGNEVMQCELDLTAPSSGVLHHLVTNGVTVEEGQTIGWIDT